MYRKPDGTNHPETNANNNKPETVRAQPWWCSTRQDSIVTDVLGESRTSLSPSKHPNGGLGTKTSESLSRVGTDDGKSGDEQPYLQHAIPVIRPTMGDYVPPPTQMELVGHSIACPSYPYADPYYGRVVPPYVPQSLVHSHILGVHPGRMALPLEMEEEPVYVNAKQYHGIMRRRQSRAKAELERKLIKVRKPYLHESRHLHAMRRARGCGGRFLNTKKLDSNAPKAAADKSSDTSLNRPLEYPNNSSSGVSITNREVTETELQGTNTQQSFSNRNGNFYTNGNGNANGYYLHHQGFHLSASHSLSDKTLEGGDCPHHHRALTIK